MLSYKDIKNNEAIKTYIKAADASLNALGFTEHSFPHVTKVAESAAEILRAVGADERSVELARIAGYMHDIGNLVNREEHSQSGAVMAFRILDKMGMEPDEIATVVTAIGNHDEGNGVPVNAVAAALILADKSDVRRTRVRDGYTPDSGIHGRVNYSVTSASLEVDAEERNVSLSLEIDTAISSLIEYFEIFLSRMILCRRAASALGLTFRLVINGQSYI